MILVQADTDTLWTFQRCLYLYHVERSCSHAFLQFSKLVEDFQLYIIIKATHRIWFMAPFSEQIMFENQFEFLVSFAFVIKHGRVFKAQHIIELIVPKIQDKNPNNKYNAG